MKPPLVSLVERTPLNGADQEDAAAALSRLEHDLARAVLHNTAALMCLFDLEGRFLLFNRACEDLSGWSAEEMLGQVVWETLVVPEERELARMGMTLTMTSGRNSVAEGIWVDRQGTRHTISWHNTVLLDEHGEFSRLVCVGVDVTEQRRAEARLRELAERDVLTGVLNRRAVFTALRAALEDPAGCGVLYCDLDGFKQVNDTHGHAVGDQLLVEVAARLGAATRTGDLVARLGGDEFVVLCPGADADTLDQVASRVREVVSADYQLFGGPVRIGISVGTGLGGPDSTPDDVLVAADRRMYATKRSRRPSPTGAGRQPAAAAG